MVNFIEGEDLAHHFNEYDAILVGTNIDCVMRHGLQYDVMIDYPYVSEANDKTPYGDPLKMGYYLVCKEEGSPTFILLYICKNYRKKKNKDDNEQYLNYNALRECLERINLDFKGKKLACPMLGCSRFDGNGDKLVIKEMLTEELTQVNVDVYDYEQISRDEKIHLMYEKEAKLKETDIEAYKKARAERIALGRARREKNKHLKY